MAEVTIRAYGALNDFLPAHCRQVAFTQVIDGRRSVKDLVESLGIPHPEIDLILINGASAAFATIVRGGDRIAVFPQFTALEIGSLTRVRPQPLEAVRFLADVHLGTLARYLRLAGLDTFYRRDADDAALAEAAEYEGRIVLTRDRGLLMRRRIAHGYFVRTTEPRDQLVEVFRRFGPLPLRPFSRCPRCNGVLHDVPKSTIAAALQPRTRQHYDRFDLCRGCDRVYWKGSHWARVHRLIDAAQQAASEAEPSARRPGAGLTSGARP